MKKWIVVFLILLVLSLSSVYIFIPANIVVTKSIIVNANQAGTHRFLTNESNWQKWWPDASGDNRMTGLKLDGYRFNKNKSLFNSFEVTIERNGGVLVSLLQFLSIDIKNTEIKWFVSINSGVNPLTRIQRFFAAKKLGNTLSVILASMAKYVSSVEHIYGLDIREERVKIEFMTATKKIFSSYPATENVYELIDQLRTYISKAQVKEEDYPMLHINIPDNSRYEAQVAIPISKQMPDSGIFSSKRMLKKGNILATEVTGGRYTIEEGMKQVDLYISDHQYNNIAIPFQSLITDRRKETDTTKWITKIYYPVR